VSGHKKGRGEVAGEGATSPVAQIEEKELEGDESLVIKDPSALAASYRDDVYRGGWKEGQGDEKNEEDCQAWRPKAAKKNEK